MKITPQTFVRLARSRFDYIARDFNFTTQERIGEGWVESADVEYDSPKVAIAPGWNSRDGIYLGITAKVDTFWIRPASSHQYNVTELLRIVAPTVLRDAPQCSWPEETEAEVEAWLAFHASCLRAHGEPLLRGDVGLCEDMLIMRYCNSTKGLPLDEYFRVFREECVTLPASDREELERAMASRSPRQVGFLLNEWVHSGRLRGERILTAHNDFWLQYFQ